MSAGLQLHARNFELEARRSACDRAYLLRTAHANDIHQLIRGQQVTRSEHISGQFIDLDIGTPRGYNDGSVSRTQALHILHQDAMVRRVRHCARFLILVAAWRGLVGR